MDYSRVTTLFASGADRQRVGDTALTTVAVTLQQDRVYQDTAEAHLSLMLLIKGAGHYALQGGTIHAFQPDTMLLSCSRTPCQEHAFFPRHFFYDLCIIDYPLRYAQVLVDTGILLPEQASAIFCEALTPELRLLHQQIRRQRRQPSLMDYLWLESLLLQALWQSISGLQAAKMQPSRAVPLFHRERQKLIKAREFIRRQPEAINLDVVARACGLTPGVLRRGFPDMFGITPWNYVIQCRLERAETLLLETEMSIDDIAVRCGFSHASHLSRFFQRQHDISPGRFRRQNVCM